MKIEIFDNGLDKQDIKDQPHRHACRGIVKKEEQYLIVYLEEMGNYTFPGGGLEIDETFEECVIRELLEETGVKVTVKEKTVEITEVFEDSIWTNHYFLCDFVKDTKQVNFTQEEIELGLKSMWMDEITLLDILANDMGKHPHTPNIHQREFLGLINSIKGE